MRVGVLIGLSLPDKGINFQAIANYAANLPEARRSGFQDSGRGLTRARSPGRSAKMNSNGSFLPVIRRDTSSRLLPAR